ncbi:MAG TPA: adenosylmethionine decarboxylase [candidate division WOR-3 bacterium]|uniref:Polyamine aminopropyltransferase n=1 Tax=candidate division WOR-3 bacterium TaxID=2052148 RepID=A0A9C9K1C6_UNCW3|nr:adenosylmethionine decarboxylase [candidate division WOR-3 bacterium]
MKPTGTHIIAEFIYCSKKILNSKKTLVRILKQGLKKFEIDLVNIKAHQFNPLGVTVVAIVGESHVAIHTYPEARHASLDIFTCSPDQQKPLLLLRFLKERFKPKTVRVVELQRGNPIEIKERNWISSFTASGFEIKYHIKKRLFSKRSKYQQIDIIENENFGKILFLDNDIQVSEFDAEIYNNCLVEPVIKAKRKLKTVAILGGGDGGVLNTLLKYKPKKVYLIDIDKDVIKAAQKYLSCICNNAFKKKNAEVVIEDANIFLEKVSGLDAVIYDLTMHPEALTNMHRVRFLEQLFSKIKMSLNKNGMISVQCCSAFDKVTMGLLKNILPRYFKNIKFTKTFIPSFCEYWVFATAKVKK